MSEKMTTTELKAIIANKIKEIGINDVLDNKAIETIKDRVMNVYNHDHAKNGIPSMIPEAVVPTAMGNVEQGIFPESGFGTGEATGKTTMQDTTTVEKDMYPGDFTQQSGQNVSIGTTGNIPAYTPDLPSFLDNVEPAKIIVFSQNELSEGGENLSNKPLRTFENPDVKKTMNEYWMENGKRKADVYMAKLEKIGELDFNYANGTTQFTEKRFEPDFEAQAKYKENPYMAGTLPTINQPIQNLTNQIATSVDVEKVVRDVVMGILRDQLLTNTERVVTPEKVSPVNEMSPEEPIGYSVAQGVKPMEEGFSVKMIDLVNEYEKIDMPAVLREAIEKKDKSKLIKENNEVQEWELNGEKYYTPVNKISNRKCYVKS